MTLAILIDKIIDWFAFHTGPVEHRCGMCAALITKDNVSYMPISDGRGGSVRGPLCWDCDSEIVTIPLMRRC